MIEEAPIRLRWDAVGAQLDERGRRFFAAAEVRAAGRGGLATSRRLPVWRARQEGSRRTTAAEAAGSPCRWRASLGLRQRSWACPRAQALGRARNARRSHAALDLG